MHHLNHINLTYVTNIRICYKFGYVKAEQLQRCHFSVRVSQITDNWTVILKLFRLTTKIWNICVTGLFRAESTSGSHSQRTINAESLPCQDAIICIFSKGVVKGQSTRIYFNLSIDKQLHGHLSVGSMYLYVPNLQRFL